MGLYWSVEPLGGMLLRYAIVLELRTSPLTMTVAEIVLGIQRRGFSLPPNPNKVVSDALRWEVRKGRATKTRRGHYGAGFIPRSSEWRIRKRMESTLAEAQTIRNASAATAAAATAAATTATTAAAALATAAAVAATTTAAALATAAAAATTTAAAAAATAPTSAPTPTAEPAPDSLRHETARRTTLAAHDTEPTPPTAEPAAPTPTAEPAPDSLRHETGRRTTLGAHDTDPIDPAPERATNSLRHETARDTTLPADKQKERTFWVVGADGREYFDLDAADAAESA